VPLLTSHTNVAQLRQARRRRRLQSRRGNDIGSKTEDDNYSIIYRIGKLVIRLIKKELNLRLHKCFSIILTTIITIIRENK